MLHRWVAGRKKNKSNLNCCQKLITLLPYTDIFPKERLKHRKILLTIGRCKPNSQCTCEVTIGLKMRILSTLENKLQYMGRRMKKMNDRKKIEAMLQVSHVTIIISKTMFSILTGSLIIGTPVYGRQALLYPTTNYILVFTKFIHAHQTQMVSDSLLWDLTYGHPMGHTRTPIILASNIKLQTSFHYYNQEKIYIDCDSKRNQNGKTKTK